MDNYKNKINKYNINSSQIIMTYNKKTVLIKIVQSFKNINNRIKRNHQKNIITYKNQNIINNKKTTKIKI